MRSASLPELDQSPVAAADPGSSLPADWTAGPFMEIFVRGYQDSDGDGRGDLRGLTQRLDYLADLGIRGLWLMPITESQDHDHGYAVTDYRALEQDYGTLEELDELLAQAHARGIGVILDYVMNHSAAQHPAFLRASDRRGDAVFDWYVWERDRPAGWRIYGNDPWHPSRGSRPGFYFAGFWDQMPDFNLQNPEVVAWHHDNLRFWLNRGVDGFRFDAVGNLVEHSAEAWENQPENYALMGQVAQLVGSYQRRYVICEGPADPGGFAAETACGAAFAFGRQYDFIAAAKGDRAAVGKVAAHVAAGSSRLSAIASNHDTFAGQRLFDQVGGDLRRYRLAAATYLLQVGTPFVYYGEEIGLAGAARLGGDPKLRTPMSWTAEPVTAGFTSGVPFRELSANVATHNVAAQLADPGSLWSFYRALFALRRSSPALAQGVADLVQAEDLVLRFRRQLGGQSVVVAMNYEDATRTTQMSGLPPGARLARAFPAGAADATVDGQGVASLTLGALEAAVFRVVP
ncbi:MAG TPA: alpha-amylase family glycosyl hydrolase [Kofleriaceae bacterium]|nr:alpha-amylase family glycosyl hydrolase [Kofleriaceae bacterium]